MVSARVGPINLPVQHVRKPGERMPVAGVTGRESPGNRFAPQAGPHPRILGQILRIIGSY